MRKKYALFFNIGMVLSLTLVLTAFEWKFNSNDPTVDFSNSGHDPFEVEIMPTVHTPKMPPPAQVVKLVEVDDNEEIDVDELVVDIDFVETTVMEDVVFVEEPEAREVAEEAVIIAETMPSFGGDGYAGFYKYLAENVKYPKEAKRFDVEGKVFVQFIVEKDGALTDIRIQKGLGYGCDEEVMRVLSQSPKWSPGKQRGVPVRVRMAIPVFFQLK